MRFIHTDIRNSNSFTFMNCIIQVSQFLIQYSKIQRALKRLNFSPSVMEKPDSTAMRLFTIYLSNLIWIFLCFATDLICLITGYCPDSNGSITQYAVYILDYLSKSKYFGGKDCVLIFHFVSKYQLIHSPTEEQLDVFPLFSPLQQARLHLPVSLCTCAKVSLKETHRNETAR